MPAIELEGLERRYGERVALSGLALRVDEGQTLAVFGANGAGKTTLLRVLAALLRPHAGDARVLGAELPKEAWRVHGKVGYLGHAGLGDPMQPCVVAEVLAPAQLAVEQRLVGQQTQSPTDGKTAPRERLAQHGDLAVVGAQKRGEQA